MLSRLRFLGFALSLLGSPMAFATAYEIRSTQDTVAFDGICTLREAFQAINEARQVNECAAGGGTNVISLVPGETYTLTAQPGPDTSGEILFGGFLDSEDRPIRATVTIEPIKDDAFDTEIKENPIIEADTGDRVFVVRDDASLVLRNVTLAGGDVSGGSDSAVFPAADGGLVYISDARLTLTARARLEGGRAANGGAVFADESVVQVTESFLDGNEAVTGDGGAFHLAAGGNNRLDMEGSTVVNNIALDEGGALYIGGDVSNTGIENTTFYANAASGQGSAIFVATDLQRTVSLNNVTIAGNDGAGPAVWVVDLADVGGYPANDVDAIDVIINSVIVGNAGGDCGGSITTDAYALTDFLLSGASCVTDDEFLPDNAGTSNTADFSRLIGDGGVCTLNGVGSADCVPLTFDNEQLGFLPNSAIVAAPFILNAGSPVTSAKSVCRASDQRLASRVDRCDPGAVEYRIAVGVEDEFRVVSGVLAQDLDYLANDLGDVDVDCTALVTAALPIVNEPADSLVVSGCVQVVQPPLRGSVFTSVDVDGRPTFSYRSNGFFHGLDTFIYRMPNTAFTGRTVADAGVSAPVVLVVEPASGLTEYDSIRDGGAMNPIAALLASLLLMRRRARNVRVMCLLAGLMGLSVSASGANIYVDSTIDEVPTVVNDGLCTLREALGNAIDETPVFSPDCNPGATGRDRIYLPEGTITPVEEFIVQLGAVEIIGVAPDLTIISGAATVRPFLARTSLTLKSLTVRDGLATGDGGAVLTQARFETEDVIFEDNVATDNGGAVFLDLNVNELVSVEFVDTVFRNNTADSGGALAMAAQTQEHSIRIEQSTFDGNVANTNGGAMAVSTRSGDVFIVNSTFTANDGSGTAVIELDPNLQPANPSFPPELYLMNTTFLNNAGDGIDIPPPFTPSNSTSQCEQDPTQPQDDILNPWIICPEQRFRVYMSHTVYSGSGGCSSTPWLATTYNPQVFRSYYSLFDSDPALSACDSEDGEGTTFAAGIAAALNGGTLVDYVVDDNQLTVPHFPISDPGFAAIVDAGDSTKQTSGIDEPRYCRSEDLRGESRLSGLEVSLDEGCDLGAYELQVPTAVADAADNELRQDRLVVVDVLANDLSGGAADIDLNTVVITAQPTDGDASITPADIEVTAVGDDRCDNQDDADPRACVLVTYEVDRNLACNEVTPDPFTDTFSYAFDDELGNPSTEAEVAVSIYNVPPLFENSTIAGKRGENVVFPLVLSDVDGTVNTDAFQVEVKPLFARFDDGGTPGDDDDDVYLGEGIIINLAARTVTYVPADRTKAFADSFSLGVPDDCGSKSTAVFRVVYNNDSASGGDLLGGGSLTPWTLLVALLWRRRRYR